MIVFPMAGLSRRFSEKGYTIPKFMLPLWDGTVFDYAVCSFANSFKSETFLFIYRETGNVRSFLEARTQALGISNARYVELNGPTAGQAETVELGLDGVETSDSEDLKIFNIDTFRMPWARTVYPKSETGGFLEVFHGTGDNWSFVRPDPSNNSLAAETAEKKAISNLCSNGLYGFSSPALFREALSCERKSPSINELYIAPLYNHLIHRGYKIGYNLISLDLMNFCGIPSDYEGLTNLPAPFLLSKASDFIADPIGT
jgi:hypothetical protein